MDKVEPSSIAIILFVGMIGMFILAISIVLFVLIYRKRLVEQQLIHQQNLIQTGVDIQEEERKRFAADLHDEIGGGISTVLLLVSGLQNKNNATQDLPSRIEDIRDQLNNLLSSVREISYNIAPDILENYGIQAALSDLCYKIQNTGTIAVDFVWNGSDERLPFSTELALYRICTELFTNTIKHAEASEIVLSVDFSNQYFTLTYEDNGKGFDHKQSFQGQGMKNMVNRAAILGADLVISGAINEGTKTKLTLTHT